ncbi:hypothetical protein BWD14_06055 [Leptospira santarosai]|uniref:Uncharacterized protein n=1 Tax=Leptospira santarosai TaxID=28183 RepID=A0AB73LUT8_9LEPT|nr:hypothetical protein BWD14_06055 [Leptospira santarosai]
MKAQCLRSLRITRPLTLLAELNDTALYGSLIFALQRAFDYAPLSTAISLAMDRSIGFGTRCKVSLRRLVVFANAKVVYKPIWIRSK